MATIYSKRFAKKFSEGILADELGYKPVILKVIGNVKGKIVLDLGCGNGKYSIILAKRGANVIAIDKSKHQIEIAKKRNSHHKIKYSVVDGANLSEIKNESIDVIFMNFIIPDIEGKRKLIKIFSETMRVLKPNGRLIFSTIHPLYLSPDQDPYDRPTDFKKKNYFKEGYIYKSRAITTKGKKIVFDETHFSLAFLSKVLKRSGFIIEQIFESKQVPKLGMYLPKCIIFKAIKHIVH